MTGQSTKTLYAQLSRGDLKIPHAMNNGEVYLHIDTLVNLGEMSAYARLKEKLKVASARNSTRKSPREKAKEMRDNMEEEEKVEDTERGFMGLVLRAISPDGTLKKECIAERPKEKAKDPADVYVRVIDLNDVLFVNFKQFYVTCRLAMLMHSENETKIFEDICANATLNARRIMMNKMAKKNNLKPGVAHDQVQNTEEPKVPEEPKVTEGPKVET